MSKTIECVSIHTDTINFSTKDGEQRSVVFEDKGGVGFAMLDEEEAEVLLGGIGRPEFWKPGTTGDAVTDALLNDPVAAAAASKLLSGEKTDGKATVKEIVELLEACSTPEDIDELVAGDERKGVVKAAEERKAALQQP
jgi:hypothetical protein